MPEKVTEKTASMPSQNAPVATAHGNSLRQETRPPSRNHIVNHQKPMNATRLAIPNRTGPPRPTEGPTKLPRKIQPTARASQISSRSHVPGPRGSSPNTRWYRR